MADENIRSALVTGASARIGRAVAISLASQGWTVAVHHNESANGAEETAEAITAAGGTACIVQADLRDESQAQGLLDKVAQAVGPITCLINNASAFEYDDVRSADRESWDLHMEVNLRAPFVLAQSFAAQLPNSQDGNIINMIDQRVLKLTPEFTSYTLSKAALWTMTQTLAQALAPRIRVNGIGPGPTLASKRQNADSFARQIAALPLGKGPEVEEIARAVDFILSMPSLTGQLIAVDGGQHLAWQTPDIAGIDE